MTEFKPPTFPPWRLAIIGDLELAPFEGVNHEPLEGEEWDTLVEEYAKLIMRSGRVRLGDWEAARSRSKFELRQILGGRITGPARPMLVKEVM